MNESLYSLLRSRFPEDPEAIFLEPPSGAGLRYGELDREAARMHELLDSLGALPGDRVLVQVEKSLSAVLLYLACLRAGAVFVPLNTAYTEAEVATFLEDASPRVLVCDPSREASLSGPARRAGVAEICTLDRDGAGSLQAYRDRDGDRDPVARGADELAAILYTSGTTGRSKGAMLSQRNLASNALTLHRLWRFEPGDVLLHTLPIFHAHGLFVALHCALLNASRVLFQPRFDAEEVLERLPEASVYMGVPTHYTRLLANPELDRARCRGMRLFISGSAPLLASTHREFEARSGHRILERYGMTEAGMITSNPFEGERVAGSVGFPLPDVEARVADEEGGALPPGETGVLEIRGLNVFGGYWGMPERNALEFRPDGFFITGDLAVEDEDGRLTLVGRAKDLIISGGFNVYPKEVEAVLDAAPSVRESAVVGVPHPDFGEGVTAVLVAEAGGELDPATLQPLLDEKLARFKHPKRFFVVEELPRNAMGKVQKKELRERYAGVYGEAASD